MSAFTFDQLVNAMTNKERNWWARNGYPGLRKKEVRALFRYAAVAERRLEHGHPTFVTFARPAKAKKAAADKPVTPSAVPLFVREAVAKWIMGQERR